VKYTAYWKQPGDDKRYRIVTVEPKADEDLSDWRVGFTLEFSEKGLRLRGPDTDEGLPRAFTIKPGNTLILKVEK
jgi:hypothetical protein